MEYLLLGFDTSLAQANQLAEELQTFIQRTCQVPLEKTKASDDTMDAGSLLTILLTAPSVVAVAKGIQTWLQKKNNIHIVYYDKDKKLIGKGLSGSDIPAFFEGAKKLGE